MQNRRVHAAVEAFANEMIALRRQLTADILIEVKRAVSEQLKKVQG